MDGPKRLRKPGNEGRAARPRRSRAVSVSLASRVGVLEDRLARAETLLAALRPPQSEQPVEASAQPDGPRCPGCRLEVPSVSRGRCPWCGLWFTAVADLRKRRRDP